jgi:hypothetical protein
LYIKVIFFFVYNNYQNEYASAAEMQQPAPKEIQWQSPPQDRLKCNIDTSFFSAVCATGWVGVFVIN